MMAALTKEQLQEWVPKYLWQTINKLAGKAVTAEEWNNLWNLNIEQGDYNTDTIYGVINLLFATIDDLNDRYYTKEQIAPWIRGGDTVIKEEVFTILTSNNGDGTFTYSKDGRQVISQLTIEGYQVFHLTQGTYELNTNRVEVIINDTLRRSVVSGGIVELSKNSFVLTSPEENGAEITVKYYERIGFTPEYNIKLDVNKPPTNDNKTIWFEIIE